MYKKALDQYESPQKQSVGELEATQEGVSRQNNKFR